jgi:shikimate kinase
MAHYLLCGFMGSGKSNFGKRLVKDADNPLRHIDMDEEIYLKYGDPDNDSHLGDMIERIGWDEFRRLESDFLEKLLRIKHCNILVSLGGGVLSASNLKLIQHSNESFLVWLDTPFETCWGRISGGEERPLVKQGKEALEKLYQERLPAYSTANIKLSEIEQKQLQSFSELSSMLESLT